MPKEFYRFINSTEDGKPAQLHLYDEIGFWGMSAKNFLQQLRQVTTTVLDVHINSPGGSVVDGFAIYNMLRAHDADIHVYVDGIAASIAAVIAMAGDTITMPENALMFVHSPLVGISGNADELRKVAEDLDKLAESIISIFTARTKLSKKKVQELMDAETLLTAKEAKENGFCDEIISELKAAASFKIEDHFDTETGTRIAAAFNKQIPSDNPSGGQRETTHKNMKFKDQVEAEARVAALEAENQLLTNSVATAKTEAHQKATDKAKADENARKSGIQTIANKYNKAGDLDAATVKALAGETTVAEFQAQVMDIINERPAKAALKQGAGGGDLVDIATAYKACKNGRERQALLRERKDEVEAYLDAVRRGTAE